MAPVTSTISGVSDARPLRERVRVLAVLLADSTAPRRVVEGRVLLVPSSARAEDLEAVLLLRVAEGVKMANGRRHAAVLAGAAAGGLGLVGLVTGAP